VWMITIGLALWKLLIVCLAILIHVSFQPPVSVIGSHLEVFVFRSCSSILLSVANRSLKCANVARLRYEGTLGAAAIHAFLSMTSIDTMPIPGVVTG